MANDQKPQAPTPNDQRSDALNPNNPAHQAAQDNRSRQLNPQDPAWHASRGKSSGGGKSGSRGGR